MSRSSRRRCQRRQQTMLDRGTSSLSPTRRRLPPSAVHPYARFGVDAVIIPFGKREGYKWFDQDMPVANLGLGGTWCRLIDDREASVHSLAGLPNAVFGFALIPIGIPAEGQPPRDTESTQVTQIFAAERELLRSSLGALLGKR